MKYKDYEAKIEFDENANIFYGEVINTRDVITFQGDSVNELRQAFADSVEDYLEFCKSRDEEPDKPFSGKFVVRISPEIHRQLYTVAKQSGKSLNAYVSQCIIEAIK